MPGLFDEIGLLFAQDAGNASWNGLLILLPIPFLFYFMIWLPQQQQEKKRRAMIDALKKNDKVVTSGGIFGTWSPWTRPATGWCFASTTTRASRSTMTRSSVTSGAGDSIG